MTSQVPASATRQDGLSPTVALRHLIDGFQVSQALYVVATLGIADLLRDGARTAGELAATVGAHPASLYRVLRALASVGVFEESEAASFALTALGACLRSDAPEPVGRWAAFIGRPYHWQAWAYLLDTVRTGETAFNRAHDVPSWEYRAGHPEESAIFDAAMTDLTRRANQSVLEAHDFGRYTTVVDVGGGRGALLGAILARYPHLRGILFDQPHVVARGLSELDVDGAAQRCQVIGGSFFDGVPVGGDAYILKTVLHDWDDEHALRILRACREASGAGTALITIEWDLGPNGGGRDARFSDLEMMVGNGGRARTIDEYAALLSATGYQLRGSTPTRIGLTLMQATAE